MQTLSADMSEQDLFGAEQLAAGQEAEREVEPGATSHFDYLHHTEEDADPPLEGSFAAQAVLHEGPSTSRGAGERPGAPPGGGTAGSAAGAGAGSGAGTPAAGEPPHSSPLHPGVGPEAKESESKSQVPGEAVKLDTKVLDTGRDLLQSFTPLKAVHEHVCAWHFYANDMSRQVEAHHYCSHPSEEMRQCCLFDSDQKGARLIGVEYIISEGLFKELPEEEKRYWHSHRYEVGSGMLVAPRVPGLAERQDMQKLIGTYGKTWHTWQVDRGDPLPYGPPQLMMAFTADGQVKPELVAERDARYGISTAEKGHDRQEKLEWPAGTDPAADHWQTGTAWQTTMQQVPFKPAPPGGWSGSGVLASEQ